MGKVFKALKRADNAQEAEALHQEMVQQEAEYQGIERLAEPVQQKVVRQELDQHIQPSRQRIAQQEPEVQPVRQRVAQQEQAAQPSQSREARRSREEPQRPALQEQPAPTKKPFRKKTEDQARKRAEMMQVRPEQWDNRLIQSTALMGPIAESIRTLRTRILHPSAGDYAPQSILVTSASPGEGKSFICANLAVSLAQGLDNYCLLVDCDLRRPTQHKLFGLPNIGGLSDYLQHKKEIPELLASSGVEKLSILQAGRQSINPAELLGSSTMVHLVDELVNRYEDRIVLLDSPPLHAASETAILAHQVDAVVLVVRYGLARRDHVRTLVESIGRDKVIGVVFNAYVSTLLDSKVFGYYDYQQSYYYTED